MGDDYTDRIDYAEWKMKPGVAAFKRILGNRKITSVLEVGANIGLNLRFIDHLAGGNINLYAVEPNNKAFTRLAALKSDINLSQAWCCDGFALPLDTKSIDLVFTSGVLIHISPDDLGLATDEIVRVSNRYVLCMEYFSHTPEEAEYRGESGMLFKRDFGAYYSDRYPILHCIDYGFLWQQEFKIFDNIHWWLFEKKDK